MQDQRHTAVRNGDHRGTGGRAAGNHSTTHDQHRENGRTRAAPGDPAYAAPPENGARAHIRLRRRRRVSGPFTALPALRRDRFRN